MLKELIAIANYVGTTQNGCYSKLSEQLGCTCINTHMQHCILIIIRIAGYIDHALSYFLNAPKRFGRIGWLIYVDYY